MTNEASKTSATKTSVASMTAWTMALSVLTGLRKTEATARAEFEAIRNANPDKPFAPGVTTATDILNSVARTKIDLEHELRRIARSNGLTMPEQRLCNG